MGGMENWVLRYRAHLRLYSFAKCQENHKIPLSFSWAQSSLTDHLVLSTLHTNSASETIVRLTEMGVDPLNFSDALLGILSQRLTLKLCDHCKQPYHPSNDEYTQLVDAYGADWFKEHNMEDYTDDFTLMKKVDCHQLFVSVAFQPQLKVAPRPKSFNRGWNAAPTEITPGLLN